MDKQRQLSSLTLVVPFYNEQGGVQAFYQQACAALDALGLDYRFVFVDDGSTDDTLRLLNALADRDSRVSVLSLTRNFGHQAALTAGLDHADGEAVVTMDGDLQHPPSAIAEMVRAYEAGAEVVYAVRANEDHRSWAKKLTARVFYRLLRRLTQIDIISGAMDFRLMSRPAVESLRQMREKHRYLRGMVPWMGFSYQIVHYQEAERFADHSKYTWTKMLRLARYGFFSFSTGALDLITLLGLALTGLAMLYLIYALVVWAFFHETVPGWTSVIAVLLVVSGVQLISVGILAQYIGMIFEEVKGRPLYLLKQKRLAQDRPAEVQVAYQAAAPPESRPDYQVVSVPPQD